MKSPDDRPHWLDDPKHLTLLYRAVIGFCLALAGAGFVVKIEGHFWWEAATGFYALYGFLAYVLLVLVAVALRRILKRPEDYYDR